MVAALEARELVARRRGDHIDARCPVHDDRRPSMTVDYKPADATRPGRVLLLCQVCGREATPDILATLGLADRDLFDALPPRTGRPPARPRPARRPAAPRPSAARVKCEHRFERVATYTYTDEAGEVVFEVIRQACAECGTKNFPVRRPDGRGGWAWKWPERRPLYRLPEVTAAIRDGRPVYVVEGEKDADALAAAGEAATCNPGGAGKWRQEHTAALSGVGHVVVIADKDKPGYDHAAMVAGELAAVAELVEVAEAPDGKDAHDHLAAGGTPQTFVPIDPYARLAALAAPAVTPITSRKRRTAAPELEDGPPHSVRVSTGIWRYSLGDDDWDRGIYRHDDGWRLLAELPHGHVRIIRRDGTGRQEATEYLLSATPDGPRRIIGHLKLHDGSWANELNMPLSDDPKVIQAAGTAIRQMMHDPDTPEREAIPRAADDGAISVPVPECVPSGYLTAAPGDRAAALAAWRQIAAMAAEVPKLAAVLGASAFAPFMRPQRRQTHWLELYGEQGQGKTTALGLAAGIWGDSLTDGGTRLAWNDTAIGLGRHLGALGILPAFFDEQGMSGFSPAQWGELIFKTCEGNQRLTAEQKGPGTRRSLPWGGIMVTSGNGRVTAGLSAGKYAGLARRVISIPAPFTRSGPEAETLIGGYELPSGEHAPGLLDGCYGHLGTEILARYTVEDARRFIAAAAAALPLPEVAVPRTLAKHLHAHIAGAAIIDQILGTDAALADAALSFARDYLAEHEGVPEHDADRLVSAVREAMAREPSRWPTVAEYREHLQPRPESEFAARAPDRVELPQRGMARDFAGVRADDGSWVAVFPKPFHGELCEPLGLDESVALGELHRRGVLIVAKSYRARGYWLTPVRVEPKPAQPPTMYKLVLPPDDEDDDQAVTPAAQAPSRETFEAPEPQTPQTPQVSGDLPPQTPPQTLPQTPPQTPAAAGQFAGCAVILDEGGIWLARTDGDPRPEPVDLPWEFRDLGEVLTWAARCGLGHDRQHGRADDGQVVIMPALAKRLGLPATAPAAGSKAAREHPALAPIRARGWTVRELRSWMSPWQEGARTLRVWLPGWDDEGDCPMLEGDPSAMTLAYRLALFATVTGITWRLTGGPTGIDLVHDFRRRRTVIDRPQPPKCATVSTLESDLRWQRQPTADEAALGWVHVYDANAMYVSAAGLVTVGLGDPEHLTGAPAFDRKLPGYWLIDPPAWSHRLLPDLFDPTGRHGLDDRRGARWITTPTLALAAELDYRIEPREALIYRETSRYYERWAARLREARAALMSMETDPDAAAVLAAVKMTYRQGVGMLAVESSRQLYRPDHRHAIVATARATLMRKLVNASEHHGRWPLAASTDAVAYASADPDPVSACPPELRIGTGLGEFKVYGSLPIAAALPLLSKGTKPDAVMNAASAALDQEVTSDGTQA
jgi:hypothetical protein